MKTDLSIIIVTYNGRDITLKTLTCYEAAIAADPDHSYEIIVVDNASRDGTADAVLDRYPGVQLIQLSANRGSCAKAFGASRAAGADTGSVPKTISIRVLPSSEGKDVAKELEGVVLPFPECRGLRRPTSPGPDLEQIRGLANASHDFTGRYWPN